MVDIVEIADAVCNIKNVVYRGDDVVYGDSLRKELVDVLGEYLLLLLDGLVLVGFEHLGESRVVNSVLDSDFLGIELYEVLHVNGVVSDYADVLKSGNLDNHVVDACVLNLVRNVLCDYVTLLDEEVAR